MSSKGNVVCATLIGKEDRECLANGQTGQKSVLETVTEGLF